MATLGIVFNFLAFIDILPRLIVVDPEDSMARKENFLQSFKELWTNVSAHKIIRFCIMILMNLSFDI